MKISHETPMCLLEDSQRFNDYDYCLPHLLDEEPKYLEYFQKAKKEGRYIIMDNSLHELGEAYSHERLIHWVNELKPNEFGRYMIFLQVLKKLLLFKLLLLMKLLSVLKDIKI
jgi:hypothetical protein